MKRVVKQSQDPRNTGWVAHKLGGVSSAGIPAGVRQPRGPPRAEGLEPGVGDHLLWGRGQ